MELDQGIEALNERGERGISARALALIASYGPPGTCDRARELSGWLARAQVSELDWLARELRDLRQELMCSIARCAEQSW